MLRSLVGSEMCIRDRVTLYDIDNSVLHTDVLEPGDCSITLMGGHNYLACLLYTSDAADDLLCVDLGGRRIIKKKNKQHITERTNNINTQSVQHIH